MNDKDQFVPLFPFGEPNQSTVIAKDQVLIKDSNDTVLSTVNAEIRLDLVPRPRIRVHTTNMEELDYPERLELAWMLRTEELFSLELKNHKKHIKAFVTTCHLSNPKELSLIFSPYSEPIVGIGNDDTQMQYVVFHLFNFKKILANRGSYSKHVNLEANNWVVELKSLAESDSIFKKLRSEGGYGLTHVGCLRKKDNTPISGKEARDMLDMLYYFFSFAKGTWCNPVCAVGFNSSDRVWESWSSPEEPGFSRPSSWFDEHHSEQLENVFPGFMNKWNDEDWNDTLQKVIYWYMVANTSRIDAGIILAQSALERLSSEHFKANPIKKGNTAKKLRCLFRDLNIPVDLTENTPILKKLADKVNNVIDDKLKTLTQDVTKLKSMKQLEDSKWTDSPSAFTGMRNYLVHSKNIYDPLEFGPAIYDSWNLELWYLELSLLKECEYSETYCNRLNSKWVGEVEKVPWEK
jgi:hypothetical protein